MALVRQTEELERLRLACRIGSMETIPKSQEILRLMDAKCRPGSLGRGDVCRTAIAFDLACRSLNCPVPHQTAVKLSGMASEAMYVAALGTAQRLLGLRRRYTCEEVASIVGGKRVGMKASTELKRYKERFIASYPARQVASIDLEGAVYAVSAFYLCAKKLNHPVDKQQLLDLALVRESEFTGVCRSMLELCYSTLGVSVADKPSPETLAHFEKTAAAKSITGTTSHRNERQVSEGGAGRDPALLAVPASRADSMRSTRPTGGGGGDNTRRRPIPLSSGLGRLGAAPGAHIAALTRSIQAASQRRRYGGKTVALAEPGGSNEANDSLNDRTHRPATAKRPRRPVPSASAAVGATNGRILAPSASAPSARAPAAPAGGGVAAAAAASSTRAGSGGENAGAAVAPLLSRAAPPSSSTPTPSRTAVHNPYTCAARRPPSVTTPTAVADGDQVCIRDSIGQGLARGSSGQGSPAAGGFGGTGTLTEPPGPGPRDDDDKYAEWRRSALASMENRMKANRMKETTASASVCSSAITTTTTPSSTIPAGAAAAPGVCEKEYPVVSPLPDGGGDIDGRVRSNPGGEARIPVASTTTPATAAATRSALGEAPAPASRAVSAAGARTTKQISLSSFLVAGKPK